MYRRVTTQGFQAARQYATKAPEVPYRPRLTSQQLIEKGLTRSSLSRYFVFQTNNESVAAYETLSPQGLTNPGYTSGVCLLKGVPQGLAYGRFNIFFRDDEITAYPKNLPEYFSIENIDVSKGFYADYDDLVRAGLAGKK